MADLQLQWFGVVRNDKGIHLTAFNGLQIADMGDAIREMKKKFSTSIYTPVCLMPWALAKTHGLTDKGSRFHEFFRHFWNKYMDGDLDYDTYDQIWDAKVDSPEDFNGVYAWEAETTAQPPAGPRKLPPVLKPEVWQDEPADPARAWEAVLAMCSPFTRKE